MKLFNRVGFSTPTIGTDNLAIGAAIRSATDGDYLTPAEAGAVNGDQSPYFIVDGHSFAQGRCTYSSTGPTLVRDPAERNWNGTTEAAGKLALSGNAVVFISPRAVDLVSLTDGDKGDIVVTGAGTVWNFDSSVVSAFARTILDDADAVTVRATLGLTIGSAVQPYSSNLSSWAGKTVPSGDPVGTSGSQTLTSKEMTTPRLSDASPTAGGQIGRLGGMFQLHDGTAVRTVVTDANAVTMSNKTLIDSKIRAPVRIVSGTSDTLVLADEGKRVETSNGSATTITVPPNSSVAFPIGTEIDLMQSGAGQVTVVAGAGVTINGTPGLKLRAQWSAATLIKRGTDTWVLVGDLSA